MSTNILGNFQICISVSLIIFCPVSIVKMRQEGKLQLHKTVRYCNCLLSSKNSHLASLVKRLYSIKLSSYIVKFDCSPKLIANFQKLLIMHRIFLDTFKTILLQLRKSVPWKRRGLSFCFPRCRRFKYFNTLLFQPGTVIPVSLK